MSPEMCEVAHSRGITVVTSSWPEAPIEGKFDSAAMLYSIGHIPSRAERGRALSKLNAHLVMGAAFYFDAFSILDESEWGPKVVKRFQAEHLDLQGYERGDVFYKKRKGTAMAFLHYFTEDEIVDELHRAGFEPSWVKYIGYATNPGEVQASAEQGCLMIKATKVREVITSDQ